MHGAYYCESDNEAFRKVYKLMQQYETSQKPLTQLLTQGCYYKLEYYLATGLGEIYTQLAKLAYFFLVILNKLWLMELHYLLVKLHQAFLRAMSLALSYSYSI